MDIVVPMLVGGLLMFVGVITGGGLYGASSKQTRREMWEEEGKLWKDKNFE